MTDSWQRIVLKKESAGDPIMATTYTEQCEILGDTGVRMSNSC